MPSSISILNFNNEPFVRTLTAQAVGVSNNHLLQWLYPNFATAQTTASNVFTTGTIGSALSARTLIFSFTSTTYDYRTTGFTLCTLPLTCINLTTPSTAICSIPFDTFPNIDLTLFINYERTNSSSYFYRLTSQSIYPVSLNFASSSFDFTTDLVNLSNRGYEAWYRINNSSTRQTSLTALTGFNRTINSVSSVQVTVSAFNALGNILPWYSPHTLERSLSARFVPLFLSADFIGYPRAYFDTQTSYKLLNPVTDLQASPGMWFYGEGQTDTIILSARGSSGATNYIWRIDNSTTRYPVSATPLTQPLTSVSVTLTSDTGTDLTLPVSLHVTNSLFLSTDPFYYYDDNTGSPVTYPYYISTTDINGNELTPRNKYRESIQVRPYIPLQFEYTPGIDPFIYLPLNGSQINYQAVLRNNLFGPLSLSACYDKYGLVWNWASYIGCSTNPTSFSGRPSSWLTVACSGVFPKLWRLEGALSGNLFDFNPAVCNGGTTTWTLSTYRINPADSWFIQATANTTDNNTYPYFLSLQDRGTNNFTTSIFEDTPVILNVNQNITCLISAQSLPAGYTNRWKPKTTTFNQHTTAISVIYPEAKFYTPNRFVLTGVEVKFENVFTRTDLLCSAVIDFDDGLTTTLTGTAMSQMFSVVYNVVGFKTLTITLNPIFSPTPIVSRFPNIVQVLSDYDQVFPSEYRSTETPIELPWPEKPHVGSNDWAVEDNINNWFVKFFDNLNYLESRGRIYPGTFSDYFGYLGVPPTTTNNISACPRWTWEDADCFNTSLPYNDITWRNVLSAEDPLDPSGKYVNCGTWKQQECTTAQINPRCFGKYDLEWSWRSRKKANTLTPVTWKQTACTSFPGNYSKKWLYEPSESQFFLVCDGGDWQVNIPGINEFYDPIANPSVQLRCIYYGVASRNNKLYLAQKTQIKVLDSNRDATFTTFNDSFDGVIGFSDIKNVCLDSVGKFYVLDGLLSQVGVYTYEPNTTGTDWKVFVSWGGFGTANSRTKFSQPNDIHIDQLDNVWISDTGNGCVKHYSNTGTWLKTIIDDELKLFSPLSVAVDSQQNVHILTNNNIRVYTYQGAFLFSYEYKNKTSAEPRKINSSYNREVIYLALDTQVLKFFRNGVFYGYIIESKENVNNITAVYHDEYRNLLITTNDKVLKYPDLMTIKRLKGTLPANYWELKDVLIHKDEYVQNWVYTKSFQRMWDNIEIFRSTLLFDNTFCKGYKPPIHNKEKMIIGQNEIVTSTTINRVLGYLWDNFNTLIDYFDPSCREPLQPLNNLT